MDNQYDLSDLGATKVPSTAPIQSSSDLSDLGATPVATSPGLLGEGAHILKEYGLGALHNVIEPLPQLSNLINRGIRDIPGAKDVLPSKLIGSYTLPQFGKGTTYEWGKHLGDALGFLGGGEALEGVRAGLEGAPIVGKLAKYLAKVPGLSRTLGTGVYGAVTSPGDIGKGAIRGLEVGMGSELLPGIVGGAAKGLGKVTGFMQPQAQAKTILEDLGGGKTLNQNAKSLTSDIQDAYRAQKGISKAKYEGVLDQVGDKNIYGDEYLDLPSEARNNFTYAAKKSDNAFLDNPTFENAHKLQSALGKETAKLTPLDTNAPDKRDAMTDARNAIKNDIADFLQKRKGDDNLGAQYADASAHYRDRVIPFIKKIDPQTPSLANIATGKIEDPRNVVGTFKHPNPKMMDLLNSLGTDTKNKILYAQLGKAGRNLTPEKLLDAYDKLDEQGLGSYDTPKLADQMEKLRNRIKARNFAQRLSMGAAGAIAGKEVGRLMPYVGEDSMLAGALTGGALGPYISRRIVGRSVPSLLEETIHPSERAARTSSYDVLRTALASYLARGGK
jgi:hypothetical protein